MFPYAGASEANVCCLFIPSMHPCIKQAGPMCMAHGCEDTMQVYGPILVDAATAARCGTSSTQSNKASTQPIGPRRFLVRREAVADHPNVQAIASASRK